MPSQEMVNANTFGDVAGHMDSQASGNPWWDPTGEYQTQAGQTGSSGILGALGKTTYQRPTSVGASTDPLYLLANLGASLGLPTWVLPVAGGVGLGYGGYRLYRYWKG